MRKHKTRLLKSHRPRRQDTIRALEEQVYAANSELPDDDEVDPVPYIVHKENYRVRPLFTDEAIMEMELSERSFIVFENAKTDQLTVVFRLRDGDYGMIVPDAEKASS